MRKLLTGILAGLSVWLLWPWLSQAFLVPDQTLLAAQQTVSVQPYADASQHDPVPVTLYYRYMQTGYLAQERRVLEVPRDQTVELVILRALLAGPSADHLELTPLFPSNVRVLRVQRGEGLVSVTLSQEFLLPPADAPSDWNRYEYWQQEVPRRRRLALAAITNALTEDGRFAKVELLISTGPEDTLGQRMVRSMFHADETDATRLLEPQTRAEDIILTPQRAAMVALEAWQHQDWLTLHGLLCQEDNPPPAQTDFMTRLAEGDRALLNYRVSVGTVAANGTQATVLVNVQTMDKRGKLYEQNQLPVPMVRERDCWKLSYATLLALMQAGQ